MLFMRLGPSGAERPAEPILFTKAPNTFVGPYDDVRLPRGSTNVNWEVELAITGLGGARQVVVAPREVAGPA
jgi:2,4-diketo-3-deoxy-L-fuconate hydrolase